MGIYDISMMSVLFSLWIFAHFFLNVLSRPPLPEIDNCTPNGGECQPENITCTGFIDDWALCKNGLLCCKPAPQSSHPEPLYPDSDECGLISRLNTTRSSRITNGRDSKEGEWPWMVTLSDSGGHFCGGTLISNQWIVTAAHCLHSKALEEISLTLGEHHLAFYTGNEETVQIRTWILHPEYNHKSFVNDIALIHLDVPVNISGHYIRTACLPTFQSDSDQSELNCFVSGWGSTSFGADRRQLQHVEAPLINLASCNESWDGVILDSHICAGDGRSGTCRGDSGGPLVFNAGGRFYLLGITSWGHSSCSIDGFPDVYTQVTSYSQWIHDTKNSFIERNVGDVYSDVINQIVEKIMAFLKMSFTEILSHD